MKSNNSKHELSDNDSQIELTSSKPNITNKLHTKEYLNNLLLEVIQTLDSMNNVISNIELQQNNLQSPGKEQLESIHTHTHSYIETNQNNINNEMSLLIKLVKTIFQKLDDQNYKCENDCVDYKLATNIEKYSQNTHNEQINLNESNQVIKKQNDLTQNIDKQKNKNSKPLIKNLKFDPKCKENQIASCTCCPIEKYYRQKGCSYINYAGRILAFNCPNDS